MFTQYMYAWMLNEGKQFNISINAEGELLYSTATLTLALNDWNRWATKYYQLSKKQGQGKKVTIRQEQKPRSGQVKSVDVDDIPLHVQWSKVMSNDLLNTYTELTVNGTRVTTSKHRRKAEFSWRVVENWGQDHMCFLHVHKIIEHKDGRGKRHLLYFGDLHSSRNKEGNISLDPFIGMPVFSVKPDRVRGAINSGACLSYDSIAAINISVVKHRAKSGMHVALARHPDTFFMVAGYPIPS